MAGEEMKLLDWLKRIVSLKPHLYIGGTERPYMKRWYLLPRNPWLNFYLHQFLREDDDRALHDHPWWFVSLMLSGSYTEWTPTGKTKRRFGSIAFRPATTRHRVTLDGKSCWTLVMTGPKQRTWGFWCPQGFRAWYDFVASRENEGEIGKGCD